MYLYDRPDFINFPAKMGENLQPLKVWNITLLPSKLKNHDRQQNSDIEGKEEYLDSKINFMNKAWTTN